MRSTTHALYWNQERAALLPAYFKYNFVSPLLTRQEGKTMSFDENEKSNDSFDKELREKKRQQINARFARGAEIMRKQGVKEHKIQQGFKKVYDIARQARDIP